MFTNNSPAQTNIQLFYQMNSKGYSDEAILALANAYQISLSSFPCSFRASGKPFISHLVGTASIMVHLEVEPELIIASLLHAIYQEGSLHDHFYSSILQYSAARLVEVRNKIRLKIGKVAEEYIYQYKHFRFGYTVAANLLDKVDSLSAEQKKVLLMRIVNEVEEIGEGGYWENGLHYYTILSDLSLKLGIPELATYINNELAIIGTEQYNGIRNIIEQNGRNSFKRIPKQCMHKPWYLALISARSRFGIWS